MVVETLETVWLGKKEKKKKKQNGFTRFVDFLLNKTKSRELPPLKTAVSMETMVVEFVVVRACQSCASKLRSFEDFSAWNALFKSVPACFPR